MGEPGQILVKRASETSWAAPQVDSYSNEAHLQAVLAADPSRIPGVAVDAVTATELPTEAGPIDVCAIGLDGSITVVECKLASNSERRRMVIGQVLDYAAAIWNSGPDQFVASWEAREGLNLREVLAGEAFDRMVTNIKAARIDLCLAVDHIDADLRRLVEYLNLASRPDVGVTALQLTYSRHDDIEILIPTTFGGELVAAKDPANRQSDALWTRELLIESCVDDADKRRVQRLFDLIDATGDTDAGPGTLWFGSYPHGGVFFHPAGVDKAPFQLWTNSKGAAMVFGNWVNYPTIRNHDGFAPIASALGQDYRAGQKGVPLADVDIDDLWNAALESAELINQ